MPTFMDRLGASSSGNSGISGQPKQQDDNDVLSIVNKLKDRGMSDFKEKSNFMSDLSLRQQQRMRTMDLYNKPGSPTQVTSGQINTPDQLEEATSGISGAQGAELGMKQAALNLDSQKMAQSTKFGQEALDIKNNQEKLNQQKSDQINTEKTADMQRKIDESNQKIQLAQQALQQKSDNVEAQLKAHQDMAAAVEERHKLELAQKDHEFQQTKDLHQKQIDALEEKIKQAGHSIQEKTDNQGNKITTDTKKGDAAETVNVIGKDGKPYTIPKDKLNDMDTDGTPHWKQAQPTAGGGEEEQQ